MGIFNGSKGPGLFFFLPCVDNIDVIVDLRMLMLEVRMLDVLTFDSITASVTASIYYRIYDPLLSITHIRSVDLGAKLIAAATLRNLFSVHSFQQLISSKDQISKTAKEALNAKLVEFGVMVERIEM